MAQNPFYAAESFDLAVAPITYTAAGLAAAKYTAGVAYYTRLDWRPAFLNGFVSALWSPGSGTAPTVYFGLYTANPAGTTLTQIGATASVGALAAGIIRRQLVLTQPYSNVPNVNPWQAPSDTLYFALLVATDAGTNKIDVATSTGYAANGVNADPTGMGGMPRALKGAGTGLTVLPATETVASDTASGLLAYCAVD